MSTDYTLPPLPDHPEPYVMRFTDDELTVIHQYGKKCAEAARAPLLAANAALREENSSLKARIAELEAENRRMEAREAKAHEMAQHAMAQPVARTCTCHPDDNPPRPCAQQYALDECRAAAPAGAIPSESVGVGYE